MSKPDSVTSLSGWRLAMQEQRDRAAILSGARPDYEFERRYEILIRPCIPAERDLLAECRGVEIAGAAHVLTVLEMKPDSGSLVRYYATPTNGLAFPHGFKVIGELSSVRPSGWRRAC